MHLLRAFVRCLDRLVGRCYHVHEFTDDPRCLLRLSPGKVAHRLTLPGIEIPPGTPAVLLHLWNERVPPLPPGGADLAYARALNRRQIASLRLVARYLQSAAEFREARVVGGITILAPAGEADGGTSMVKHFGFQVMPYYTPLGRFGEFWENFFTWSLMWTYNPASLRGRPLWSLRRSEFWMAREMFQEKFGGE